MANPISNEMFSHDYAKFVLQQNDPLILPPILPVKPFSIKSSQKTKKDLKKEKSPWSINQNSQNK